jgi:hypothetical protein
MLISSTSFGLARSLKTPSLLVAMPFLVFLFLIVAPDTGVPVFVSVTLPVIVLCAKMENELNNKPARKSVLLMVYINFGYVCNIIIKGFELS